MSQNCSRVRVGSVLLVGSPYDAFLLEQAGFRRAGGDLPGDAPEFELARNGQEALALVARKPPDLVIADYTLSDMTAIELGEKLSHAQPRIPVMVVTSRTDLGGTAPIKGKEFVEGLFIWYGDPEVLRTLVCLYEDERNAEILLRENKALAILLVEDEPNFYSHYLPTLYMQIRKSTLALIPEEMHPASPWEVIKGRPLVLLRQTYEGAVKVLDSFPHQHIAIITDMQFPVGGTLAPDAGLRLLYRARSYEIHMPVVVQSRQIESRAAVEAAGGTFLWKDSAHLLSELKEFLATFCGFGSFVFRWPDGREWARANTLDSLKALIAGAPQAVFEHHGKHNDFSAWLGVHGYSELAAEVRRIPAIDVTGRPRIIECLDQAIRQQEQH